jgi:hypothetical protein
LTVVGVQDRPEDPHHGGLAGTVRAQQTEDGAGPNVEIHTGERRHVPEPLVDPANLDRDIGHGGTLPHVVECQHSRRAVRHAPSGLSEVRRCSP